MRSLIRILCLTGLFFSIARSGQAGHLYGGEISYVAVSPGIFTATYTAYYVAAAGIIGPQTMQFNLRAPGCSSGSLITGNRQSTTILNVNGSSRCSNPAVQLMAVSYTATFLVPSNQCPEWSISVRECPKNAAANLQTNPNTCLYVEAGINIFTAFLQKSSPVFLPPTSLMFNVNNPATLNSLALQTSPETDSIVYALKPALDEYNVPIPYTVNHTFSQPVPSVSGVSIHPRTGQITFTPNVYNSSGVNFYTVVVEATEYRKMAGGVRKVSSSQRSIPVFIVNHPANTNPELVGVMANGQPVLPNEIVQVNAGSSLVFQFNTADANAADSVKLDLPAPQYPGLPANTVASITPGSRPTGTLTFNPSPSATDQLIYFPVSVTDNFCPVRGVTTRIYGVRIKANPTGQPEDISTNNNFTVFPNPLVDNVSFSLTNQPKATGIIIYNLLGQKVDQIFITNAAAEKQTVAWPHAGKSAPGTYVARLISGHRSVQTLKFIKLK